MLGTNLPAGPEVRGLLADVKAEMVEYFTGVWCALSEALYR